MEAAQKNRNPNPELGIITDVREDLYQNVFNQGIRPQNLTNLQAIISKIAHVDLHKNLNLVFK